ncbi:glutaredoxin-like protein NrdH [Mycolicibacterium fallax]|uniref:Glutaredoxin-like protein NrdH n=1 Tax=Mycolicibacterium fallax TaxID=1793 RepID=A0A1X1R8B0_MYCFA|nr:glutaredoxin-like protein NrdH [Mycolicibacterium fallax]ORV00981.1 NrdH-redoxin [Mycolicibacterium fallax]
MSTVTLYTKPQCPQCVATKKWLNKNGADFAEVDLTTDPDARDYVMSLGYLSAPVIVAGSEHWSGFRPDRLDGLGRVA